MSALAEGHWRRLACVLTVTAAVSGLEGATPQYHAGMCDASAAVALDEHTVLIADDEQCALRIYAADRSASALQQLPVDLGWQADPSDDRQTEFDIEGAAQIQDVIYWIASHGRNKNGVLRPDRHLFFAVRVRKVEHGFVAIPVGSPFRDLAYYLAADPRLQELGVQASLRLDKRKAKELAPKLAGLNIEGLCETREGGSLLIGLRNPQPMGKALIVELRNPEAVLMARAKPELGPPILLDVSALHQGAKLPLGIRSLALSPRRNRYLIVAGPSDSTKVFALFEWTGRPEDSPRRLTAASEAIARLASFTPEALVVHRREDRVQLFSDDGSLAVTVASPAECVKGAFKQGRCEAKDLLDDRRKTFRSLVVTLDAPVE